MEKVAVADKGDTKNGGAISSAADLLKLRVDYENRMQEVGNEK